MTIEEKLQHFTTVTIEDVQKQCDKAMDEYKAELEGRFERHKMESLRLSALAERKLQDAIERQASLKYTMEQLHLRRKINRKQSELRERLFKDVEDYLIQYRTTAEYKEYLARQIDKAVSFANGEEIHIFIDADDKHLREELEYKCNVKLQVAEHLFKGGIRAELPIRNILIDNTFETKLEEEMEQFVIGRKEA